MRKTLRLALCLGLLGVGGPTLADPAPTVSIPFPTGRTETVNIIQWDSNRFPIYERSDQLPLTDADLVKLSAAGFTGPDLVKMLQERRCACDASADGLIKLKKAGVPKEVIAAVSLHALPPNRSLPLLVTVDLAGVAVGRASPTSGQMTPRNAFLYFFIDDGPVTRVFMANIAEMSQRRFQRESMVDRSDQLLNRETRRIELAGDIPLKTYGPHKVLVVSSARPTITHPSELNEVEKKTARTFTFDYPRSSISSVCRLNVGFQRDAMLPDVFTQTSSRFECEWE